MPMTRRILCPPPPTSGAAGSLQRHVLTPSERLYRVFRGASPIRFGLAGRPGRFDPLPAPWASTQVLYAASTREAAISETILRRQDRVGPGSSIMLSASQIAGRQIAQLGWNAPVEVLDFTGFGLNALAELMDDAPPESLFLADRAGYPMTQAWGAWFRSACPGAAGFRWMSRQYNRSDCYVFFEDACTDRELLLHAAPEPIERGTDAFALLERSLADLGWEMDEEDP
jgi:hypothetical protein